MAATTSCTACWNTTSLTSIDSGSIQSCSGRGGASSRTAWSEWPSISSTPPRFHPGWPFSRTSRNGNRDTLKGFPFASASGSRASPARPTRLLQRLLDLPGLEDLQHVALLDVLVAVEDDAALQAFLDLA